MKTLSTGLRRQLERTVTEAREVAETGARVVLETLAVHQYEPYEHMGSEQRTLHARLRARARQLGDRLGTSPGTQALDHLVRECAFEHWHGMLFARFLAENHLLIEPEMDIAVSMDECEALAEEEGVNKWALAARYAQRMLPQVFRPEHPVFEVQFAQEFRLKLEDLVEGIPADVFTATDSLGWVYQFWQSKKKDEVNRSEVKIGADELPALTQLFTEPYMVQFLLDNSLGAWWAASRLSESDLKNAGTEDELRRRAATPGVPLESLRFVQREDPAGQAEWSLAAGSFDDWPEHLADLKVLDPCCGSGHFLVAAFLMLVPMRVAREGLSVHSAVDAVLRDNLHGLELDPRCVELAAFALALAAWTYPGAGGYRPLPMLNIACSGLSVGARKKRWTALAAGQWNLRIALAWMHGAFADAPVLGSLLNPGATKAAKLVDWRELSKALEEALAREQSDGRRETAIAAQGLARAAELLARRYHWVITNVPYLARGKQGVKLRAFCEQRYPTAKNDLATVFLERCLELCTHGGTTSLVLPQNWLFLTSYRKLREKLLRTETWHVLARLGPGAFETISGEVVKAILLTLSRSHPTGHRGEVFEELSEANTMFGLDVSELRTAGEKENALLDAGIKGVEQAKQLENPDARIALEDVSIMESLGDYCSSIEGLTTGDLERFVTYFWEGEFIRGWEPFIQNVHTTTHYGGRTDRIFWQDGNGELSQFPAAHNFPSEVMRGKQVLGRVGLRVTQMRNLAVTAYSGEVFGKNGATVVPHDSSHLPAIWCFCSSPEYHKSVRRIDRTLKVTNATLVKVPFDLARWSQVAEQRYPNGLPKPYSDDPTQWIFHGHPCGSVVWDEREKRTAHGSVRTNSAVLQVAVARLLNYRWPAEQDANMELADEQRKWAMRSEQLLDWADEDGIVCIPSVRGEQAATERLLQLLAGSFGDAWNDGILTKPLIAAASPSLDDWLRNRFFEQHCKLFHQRPFIWHIWDGRKNDGFHALVNYHKLAESGGRGHQLIESLTYSYLGDWINRQQDGVKRGEGGAEERLVATMKLQKRLIAIIKGDPPFDIFIRWKPIDQQPIGWDPDINDGVRLNIRPFMTSEIPSGRKGAGILWAKPNLHWKKDRGKEPIRDEAQFPWFWSSHRFTGDRVNDVHLTIAEKRTARNEAGV